VPAALSCALARQLCEAEVPEGPEEEAELDGLRRQLTTEAATTALSLTISEGLSFWLMKRRAGQVGTRFGREYLSVLTGSVRTHLIGHSFGGKLATAAVAAGGRPESLTLLLAAFSAFAFAPAVPGFRRRGVPRARGQRRVERPIVVLRSDHDWALHRLYQLAAGVPRRRIAAGRSGYRRMVVACSALGAVGPGVGRPADWTRSGEWGSPAIRW
jgi:pimeloyl-ACP methyl ester carboxylesterase